MTAPSVSVLVSSESWVCVLVSSESWVCVLVSSESNVSTGLGGHHLHVDNTLHLSEAHCAVGGHRLYVDEPLHLSEAHCADCLRRHSKH